MKVLSGKFREKLIKAAHNISALTEYFEKKMKEAEVNHQSFISKRVSLRSQIQKLAEVLIYSLQNIFVEAPEAV
jgi:hypothetical protein